MEEKGTDGKTLALTLQCGDWRIRLQKELEPTALSFWHIQEFGKIETDVGEKTLAELGALVNTILDEMGEAGGKRKSGYGELTKAMEELRKLREIVREFIYLWESEPNRFSTWYSLYELAREVLEESEA